MSWLLTGLFMLGCGGLGAAPGGLGTTHGEFALATAKHQANENDGVECRLTTTGGGTATILDWRYTFGDPVVRPYPEEMKAVRDNWGKVVGQRSHMMLVPITIENTQPTKRAHQRKIFFYRRDGEFYEGKTSVPDWVLQTIGKPNLSKDREPYAPGESRDVFVMLSVESPTTPLGSVMRIYYTEERPSPKNPRKTYYQTQDQVCIEVMDVLEAAEFVKP